ncbi:MAG: chemotaxis protein CheW [Rhodothermaceae bacterium]|nr:chemotaxis protein CheW [Rhodothermaceae bacterium]
MNDQKQFCTFQLDDMLFGIDVLNVQEIILPQEMTEVPLAPSVISGLINLRGQVVTAINLGKWLGIESEDEASQRSMNVVICTDDEVVSFLVDSIGDVVEPNESSFEPPPQTLEDGIQQLINGVYKLDSQLLLVMDVARTVELFTETFNGRSGLVPVIE